VNGREPQVGQDGRIDAAGQLPQGFDGFAHVGNQALQHFLGLLGIGGRHILCYHQLQLQSYQLLLGAVVQVALDPAALGVLGRDQALAGYRQLLQSLAELGGEALVLETEPGPRAPGR
jgi:hypothetical protein